MLIWSGQATAAGAHRYAIASQPLGAALKAFALGSGRDVVFDPDLVRGKTAHGLSGNFTDEAALSRLLDGAGLAWSVTSAGAFVVRAAPAAYAQAEPPMVDELIITANKREERAHDVAASVSAVTGDSLAAVGAVRLQDYAGRIPGLAVSNVAMANGSHQLTIRGVTTGTGGNPTVGVYIDDAPFGSSTGFGGFNAPDLDPQDLARIEVLRGPQGTLYGAGSLGGLLKYVTATPDPSHAFGRLQVDGSATDGGGQGYGLRGSVNLPLSDRMAVRLSAYDREDPGYIDNVLTGQDNLNDGRFYGGRASLGMQLNDAWKVRLSALYESQRDQGPIVDYDAFTFRPIYGDLKQSRGIGTGADSQQIGSYSLEIEGQMASFATLTSSSSYNKQTMFFSIDTSAVFASLIESNFGVPNVGSAITTDNGLDKFTQEIRLASPAENRLSWQIGGFYTHENTVEFQGMPLFDPQRGTPIGGLPSLLHIDFRNRFEEAAAFGDATYHFGSRFDLTGGVRYSHNRQNGAQVSGGMFAGGDTDVVLRSDDSSVTYLVSPRFHLNRDTMIYARLASGYRPGGPNPNFGSFNTPLTYGPDKVVNYELGIKSDLLNHHASIEVAAYWIDWKDVQVQEINPLGISFIDNAGSAVSKGVEASGSWRPVHGLQIDAALAYDDAHLTAALPARGAVAPEGDPLPLSPRWSGNLAADYRFPIAGRWTGVAGAEWRHVGQTLGSFANPGLPRFVHPAYDVVNLRAGIGRPGWSLDAYARNIGDSRGQSAEIQLGTTSRVSVNQPRTFGLAITATF